jgi:hypothetical protein
MAGRFVTGQLLGTSSGIIAVPAGVARGAAVGRCAFTGVVPVHATSVPSTIAIADRKGDISAPFSTIFSL